MPAARSRSSDGLHAGIKPGEIERVIAVILDEEFQRLLHFVLGRLGAERAADQHGRAVADIRGHRFVGQGGHAHVRAGGIDGVHQVFLGIDQGAVQIEDQKIHTRSGGKRQRTLLCIKFQDITA